VYEDNGGDEPKLTLVEWNTNHKLLIHITLKVTFIILENIANIVLFLLIANINLIQCDELLEIRLMVQ